MAFDARAHVEQHADDYPPFEFIDLDGTTHKIPNVLTFSQKETERFQAASADEDAALGILTEVAGADAVEAISHMPGYAALALISAWQGEAEEAGKSLSTSPETNRQQRRSKQTSPDKAKRSKT